MDFRVGHLLFSKGIMLRVIGTGTNHIDVIEYSDSLSFGGNDMVTRTYSLFEGTWYRWGANGGEPAKLKKIGIIGPSKVPHMVKDFSQIQGFDTIIIRGVPYKQVETTSLVAPEHWTNVFYLKSKNEAIFNIQEQDRESLYDRGASGELLTSSGIVKLKENDVWMIVKH